MMLPKPARTTLAGLEQWKAQFTLGGLGMYAVEWYGPTPNTLGAMSWQRLRGQFSMREACMELGGLQSMGYKARIVKL